MRRSQCSLVVVAVVVMQQKKGKEGHKTKRVVAFVIITLISAAHASSPKYLVLGWSSTPPKH